MIHAENRKKLILLREDEVEAHPTLYEDATTSAFFERISYIDDDVVFLALKRYLPRLEPPRDTLRYRFWPNIHGVEPDLLVESASWSLVVEAKLESGLSGNDQLGKEVLAVCRGTHFAVPVAMLFITADCAEPDVPTFEAGPDGPKVSGNGTVDQSIRSYLHAVGSEDALRAIAEYSGGVWVNWRDFTDTVRQELGPAGDIGPPRLRLLDDLVLLLRKRGMFKWKFNGFEHLMMLFPIRFCRAAEALKRNRESLSPSFSYVNLIESVGLFMKYNIGSVISCLADTKLMNVDQLSWSRLIETAGERSYGEISDYLSNRVELLEANNEPK